MSLTYGSLFSGIGGIDLAFDGAGMRCRWQVEIDADASHVLAHHWPDVPRFSDVRWCGKNNLPRVDVICGGFPCQDLSVAGKRGGLQGSRSGLWYEMVRITDELRPGLLVFENVPGLLSSDAGRDFCRVLRSLADIGYFGAWRVLDAQFFGVPQRRRRVFGVFARGRAGIDRAAKILALGESGARNPQKGRKAREGIAGTLGSGTKGAGWRDDLDRAGAFVPETAFCLPASGRGTGDGHGQGWNSNYVTAATLRSRQHKEGVNPPGRGGEDDQNLIAFATNSHNGGAKKSHARKIDVAATVDQAGGYSPGQGGTVVSHTLRAEGHDASEDGTGRGVPMTVQTFQPTVARNGRGAPSDVVGALKTGAKGGNTDCKPHVFGAGMAVRRLTPVECSRLQGFPDGWLDLSPPLSDSAKYRLLGNAVAVPVAAWIGRRIMEAETQHTSDRRE